MFKNLPLERKKIITIIITYNYNKYYKNTIIKCVLLS